MTLEEVIKQRLAEANLAEAKKIEVVKSEANPADVGNAADVVDVAPTKKKVLTKESLDEMTDEELTQVITSEDLNSEDGETLDKYIEEAVRVMGSTNGQSMTRLPKKNAQTGEDNTEKRNALAKQVVTARADKKSSTGSSEFRADSTQTDSKGGKVMKYNSKNVVSEQVNALLEVEGLSEEFKLQAVTIFEAAVTDRVLQIEENLKTEFETQLATAKSELDNDIDGFLSEAIQTWKAENEVAIKANFKSQVAESFIDGMKALIAEHNIEVPEDKENALEVALLEVDKLNETAQGFESEKTALTEQINSLKAEKILESFKEKMTQTEFDRFTQLTESVKYANEEQYTKQLNIVKENFGSDKTVKVAKQVTEEINLVDNSNVILTESNSNVNAYASYITSQKM